MNLFKGEGAWCTNDDIGKEFVACTAHPYPAHLGNVFHFLDLGLKLGHLLAGSAVKKDVDGVFC